MTWLVTGGARYIGSHVVWAFSHVGLGVVVLDDLSSGHSEFVPTRVPLVVGNVVDTTLVEQTLTAYQITGSCT
jgi:UDP-glucose 4-epimerase